MTEITKETLEQWRDLIAEGVKFAKSEKAIGRLLDHIESQNKQLESLERQNWELREALKAVVMGNDMALERGSSIELWRDSPLRRQALAALFPPAPKEEAKEQKARASITSDNVSSCLE